MLSELEIKNVALIDQLSIEFKKGLNILTGETGAGKSIIIDAINAILGGRTSRELIRTGADKAEIQAVFSTTHPQVNAFLESQGIHPEEDGTMIISRQISESGKNTCRINGNMVTVSVLKDLGQHLIDVHGQHENQSLLRTETHIETLDVFAGMDLQKMIAPYQDKLCQLQENRKQLSRLMGSGKNREREMELLQYQLDEISKAALKIGEDDILEKQLLVLSNAERIKVVLNNAYHAIVSADEGVAVTDTLNTILSEIKEISTYDEQYHRFVKSLEEVVYIIEDTVTDIRRESETVEFDPYALEELTRRLDLVNSLKRKYGDSIEEILAYYKEQSDKLEEMVNSQELIETCQKKEAQLKNELYHLAAQLSNIRQKTAEKIELEICRQLEELEMKNARFKVDIQFNREQEFTAWGLDQVEFLISPNRGEQLKPLAKIASGGEMSRIMLAIKTILADIDSTPTLIFDEIDAGVSGKTAQKVGGKLSELSGNHQVLCVTHHAQIACLANQHFLIEKSEKAGRTRTQVNLLTGATRQNEIARLLSGENVTENTLRLAKEMLNEGLD